MPIPPTGQSQLVAWRKYPAAFSGWSLRSRLIAIVLALAVPLNFVIVGIIWSLAKAAEDAQRTSLLYSARSVASGLDAELGKYLALAQALSRSPQLLTDDLSPFEREARRTFEAVPDAWVLVSDLAGLQLLNTASPDQLSQPKRLPFGIAQQD